MQNGWPECASHFDRGEVPVLPDETCFCTHGLKPCEKGPGPAASLPQPGLRRPELARPCGPLACPRQPAQAGFPCRVRRLPQAGPDGLSLAQP